MDKKLINAWARLINESTSKEYLNEDRDYYRDTMAALEEIDLSNEYILEDFVLLLAMYKNRDLAEVKRNIEDVVRDSGRKEKILKFFDFLDNYQKTVFANNEKTGNNDVNESEDGKSDALLEQEFVVKDVFPRKPSSPDEFYEFADKACGGDDYCGYELQYQLDNTDPVVVNGNQTDVDDWDTWGFSITDCCGGWENCFDRFPEWFFETYKPEDKVSFRAAIGKFIEYLQENAQELIDAYAKDDPGFYERVGTPVSKGGQWTSKSRFY